MNFADCYNIYEKIGKDIIFEMNELYKKKIINNNEQKTFLIIKKFIMTL